MQQSSPSLSVVIPTLNAGSVWTEFLLRLWRQTAHPDKVLVLDSGSTDGTDSIAQSEGCTVVSIPSAEFNHGGTRQRGADMLPDSEILVYLTQDAMPFDDNAIARLVDAFRDPAVGATYGRQMPRIGANPVEAHARLFNYPQQSSIRSWDDRVTLGIRATFLSNSFAAYRRSALMEVGGFPSNTIMAEDAIVAARLLKAHWKIAYVADSAVLHSHPYSVHEEFRRYFDLGVFHNREQWMLQDFGTAGKEGMRFVVSEFNYLLSRSPLRIPGSLLRLGAKLVGYRLGRQEERLPPKLVRRLSMHKRFWDHQPG